MRIWYRFLLLINTSIAMLFCDRVFAQNEISISNPEPSNSTSWQGAVRYESMNYLVSLPAEPDLTHTQFLSARLAGGYEGSTWKFATDFQAGTFFNLGGPSTYSVQELYGSVKLSDSVTLSVGRKKYDWSAMDSFWHLTLWEPNYAFDVLRPEVQGLSGMFLDFHPSPNFRFVGFATDLYIPNAGADIREENGTLVSNSRWFSQPSPIYDFNNHPMNINYSLEIPSVQSLVVQPGAAMSMTMGNPAAGPWWTVSGGYKPVNDLILKRQGYAQTTVDQVDVILSPDVTNHEILSTDIGFKVDNFQIVASYLQDNPKTKYPTQGWEIQDLQPMSAYSIVSKIDVHDVIFRSYQVKFGYLRIFGGGINDILPDGSKDSYTIFDTRVKFKDAFTTGFEGLMARVYGMPLKGQFTYLWDWLQRGSMINTEFQLFPRQNFAVLLGADFLGVQVESDSTGFLNQYRDNGRVYGGVTYVF